MFVMFVIGCYRLINNYFIIGNLINIWKNKVKNWIVKCVID